MVALALLACCAASARAGSGFGYDLTWGTFAPGLPASGGGRFALRGAVGQPMVDGFSGGVMDGRAGYYQRATVWWELSMPVVRRR
jgi:hypothetical protein